MTCGPRARLLGKVDLIINPSASHFAMSKTDLRYKLVLNASRQFACTYLYANLLGNEAGRIIYDGEILIARNGHLLKRNQLLSFKAVDMEWADVDFTTPLAVADVIVPLPEPDEYRELNQAMSLGLFDYLRKARSRGFVLSLSGGADSSFCAVGVAEMVRLGVEELGVAEFKRRSGAFDEAKKDVVQTGAGGPAEQVVVEPVAPTPPRTVNQALVSHLLTCAYQGTVNSSDDTFNSAKELAESIGARFFDWTIDDEVRGYVGKIEGALGRAN